MAAVPTSIKEIKAALNARGLDYSGLTEKSELVSLLQKHQPQPPSPPSPAEAPPADSADLEDNLSKINNLLDTLPASLTVLDKKWSEQRCEKIRGQLKTVKSLLDATAISGASNASWQSKLDEFNSLARDFKRIRDLPRNMNG